MARLPRMGLPDIPHHVTQRGNRRERTFFEDGDYALYLDLLAAAAERAQVEVWSYTRCLTTFTSWYCPLTADPPDRLEVSPGPRPVVRRPIRP